MSEIVIDLQSPMGRLVVGLREAAALVTRATDLLDGLERRQLTPEFEAFTEASRKLETAMNAWETRRGEFLEVLDVETQRAYRLQIIDHK